MESRSLKTLEFTKIRDRLETFALTQQGRRKVASLVPESDVGMISAALDETEDALEYILEAAPLPLSGVECVDAPVQRARIGLTLEIAELNRVGRFLRAVERLKRLVPEAERRQPTRLVFERMTGLDTLTYLRSALEKAIVADDEIADGASPLLASIRRRIIAAQDSIKEQLDRLIRSAGDALQEPIVTLRGDRYVVPVKAGSRRAVPGLVHDTSSSGQTLFIEPMAVVEKNNQIRELIAEERDEILRILAELSAMVAGSADALLMNEALITDLDFSMAKAKFAHALEAARPLMNRAGRIVFNRARHPLLDPETVVPIDFRIADGVRSLVITGPNTGGKTVSLKTCGLFCLMAHSGLFLPAAPGAEIPYLRDVLADIGDEQSIEQSLSTFSSHMTNIVSIEKKAGPGTLVLLDELGAGTDPSEGAALAIAILDSFLARGCLTVATTHYRELKGYALNTPGVMNASSEFDLKTLRPTYRLLIGVPGVSQAFAISERLGLPVEIIGKARSLVSDEGRHFESMVSAIKQSHVEAKRIEGEIEALKQESAVTKRQLEEERKKIRKEREAILDEARLKAAKLYEEARRDVDEALADFATGQKPSHKEVSDVRGRLSAGRKRLGRTEKIFEERSIRKGAYVRAERLGIEGEITDLDAKGQATLMNGPITVKVSVSELTLCDRQDEPKKKTRRAAKMPSRARTIQSELMLLGKTVEEAKAALDAYLDDAVLAGLTTLRIVHGKGTGALRSAVAELLRSDGRVDVFRHGGEGEGGDGVTVVSLKY